MVGEVVEKVLVIREYDPKTDLSGVEDVERRCEVGPSGKLSLFTDLLGDPICRVRNSPAFFMLVNQKKKKKNPLFHSNPLFHNVGWSLHYNFFFFGTLWCVVL